MTNKRTKPAIQKPTAQNKNTVQQPVETNDRFSLHFKLAFLLGIMSCLVYANTLKNGFVYDDIAVIKNNTIVSKGVSAIPEILSTPYRRGFYVTANDFYRPLSLVMFATEYQFFGKNPMIYHFINILLFSGCVILLFLFLDKLFERKKTGVVFIAALLFALHPIHTEVVANIKSRDELLCFFCAFLSLNVFIKYMQTGKTAQLLLGSICFLLALLSKETVITFLVIIPFIFFFYRNENKKYSIYIFIGAVIATAFFLSIRYSVLNAYDANHTLGVRFIDNSLAKPGLSFESRIATAVLVLGYYIKLLFIPYPLISDYSFNSIPFTGFSDPWVLISLAVYIFLAVFGIKRFLKNKKNPYAFGILFFLITLALFSNIPFLIGATMGERFMFFPSVGFCLVVAFLLEKVIVKQPGDGLLILKNKLVLGIVIPVFLVFAVLTIDRNSDWVDNYTLFKTDADKSPDNSKLDFFLSDQLTVAYTNEQDNTKKTQIINDIISYLNKALAIYPDNADAQMEMGWAYTQAEKYDSAVLYSKKALELNPSSAEAMNNLAAAYISGKKYPDAIKILQKMIAQHPNDENAHMRIGDAFLDIGQYDSSEVHDKRALELNPKNADATNNLAGVYFFNKNYPLAIAMYKRATELRQKFVGPCANISVCYLYLNKNDSAIYYANSAISIDPTYKTSYVVLAAAYKAIGNADSAKKYDAIVK